MKKVIFCSNDLLLVLLIVNNFTLTTMNRQQDYKEHMNSPAFKSIASKFAHAITVIGFYMPTFDLISPIARWYIVLMLMIGGLSFYAVRKWILYRLWSNTEEIKKVTKKTEEDLGKLINDSTDRFSVAQQERIEIKDALSDQGKIIHEVNNKADAIQEVVTTIDSHVDAQENCLKALQDLTKHVQKKLDNVEEKLTTNTDMLEQKVNALQSVVVNGFDDLNTRCDNLHENLGSLESSLTRAINTSIEHHATQTNSKFTIINDQLGALQEQEKLLSTQLSSLRDSSAHEYNELLQQLDQLGKGMSFLTTKVDDVAVRFSTLEGDVFLMKGDIVIIKTATVTIENHAKQQLGLLLEYINPQRREPKK